MFALNRSASRIASATLARRAAPVAAGTNAAHLSTRSSAGAALNERLTTTDPELCNLIEQEKAEGRERKKEEDPHLLDDQPTNVRTPLSHDNEWA